MPANQYRPDIDGLRAIAVLAVVAFHAFPDYSPGGFVGVDIFFVISGYLITGIISREIDAGTYGTLRFYERRLRRIAPAFLVVCAVSAIAAAFLYTPDHFELFGESLIAAVLIHANIFFFKEAGYFVAPDDVMPLLHIWSLSVEEQFYVFFPIALVLLTRWRNLRVPGIAAGIAVSFVAACIAVVVNPDAAFYLAHFRAWEMLVGSLLAVNAFPPVRGRAADACSWAGVALLAVSIWGLSNSSVFPGWTAALPCVGAALLIHAGPQASANRAVAFRPMVGIGLISYSLYLWHWPLLSFGAYVAMRPLSGSETAIAVAASVLAAWLSYVYVERPFRRPVNRIGLAPLFGGVAALLVAAAVADATKGASWRLPAAVATMTDSEAVRIGMPSGRCKIVDLVDADHRLSPLADAPRGVICRLGDPTVKPTVVMWGDSHGDAATPALDAVLAKAGKAGYSFSRGGCPPIYGLERLDRSTWQCARFAAAALEAISAMKPEAVIIAARWAYYFEGSRYAEEQGPGPVFAHDGNFEAVAAGLDETLRHLRPLSSQLTLVKSIPEVGFHVPSTLGRAAILGRHVEIAPTRVAFEARQERSAALISRLADTHDAEVVDPSPYLCGDLKCDVVRDGKALYADYNHLSQAGAALLIPMFDARAPQPLRRTRQSAALKIRARRTRHASWDRS